MPSPRPLRSSSQSPGTRATPPARRDQRSQGWTGGWGGDVLAAPTAHHRTRPTATDVPAEAGLVVEDAETGWCGAIVRVEKSGGVHVVALEDRRGRVRAFPLGAGFLVDGAPVRLLPPTPSPAATTPTTRTASGSFAPPPRRARVARASRIWVEGKHDAELVEKVWGDDLRVEGVVVEGLDGVDHLADALADFRPGPGRRVGVLVDHLVHGTKETRLVTAALAGLPASEHVHVVGHPFVDVWAAVRADRIGLARWPSVPRSVPWKVGVAAALGWPHASARDLALAWQRILSTVTTIADLDPAFSGRVEELIDFTTGDASDR